MVSFYADGDYKFVIKDSVDVTLYTWDNIKITSDDSTLWEGNAGTAYPTAATANRFQQFVKHNASNEIIEIGINKGAAFMPLTLGIYASAFSNFTDAVTAAANKTLIIDASINLPAGAITIPATVSVYPIQGGIINKSSATSLTINGHIVGNPMHQWLNGFSGGEIVFGARIKEAYLEWTGADGSGNQNIAIEVIIRACYTNKIPIIATGKTFRSDSELAVYTGTIIRGVGSELTIFDFSNAATPQNGFVADAGTESTFTQANNISIGASSYVHSSALPVTTGDFIGFKANTDFATEFGGELTLYTVGELFRVKSVSGNTVNFDEGAAFALPSAGANSGVYITPLRNIYLSGFSVKVSSNDSAENDGIRLIWCDHMRLSDIRSEGAEFSQIRITHSMDVVIDKPVLIGDGTVSGQDYGIAVMGGSKHVKIYKAYGEICQHIISGGGSEGMIPMYVEVVGLTTRRSLSNSFDTHIGTYSWIYRDCQVDNGFNIAGVGHIIDGVISAGGPMEMYSGAFRCKFKNIINRHGNSWGSNSYPIRECSFEDIDLDLYNLVDARNRIIGQDNSFKRYRIKNKSFSITADAATNDATLLSTNNQHIGLQLGMRNYFEDVYLYGFAIGLFVQDSSCAGKRIYFEECGWDTSLSSTDSVILLNLDAINASLEDIAVKYTSATCDNTAASVIIRMDSTTGSDTGDYIKIRNVYHPNGHTVDYSTAISVAAAFSQYLHEYIRVNGSASYNASSTGTRIEQGSGVPSIIAPPSSIYYNLAGGTGTTLYVKETLYTSSGWVAK